MSGAELPAQEVAVLVPVLARHDAISQSAIDTWRMLTPTPGLRASLLTSHNELPEIPAKVVGDLGGLLRSPEFLNADLIIYHFGLHHPLFDAMLIGNGHAQQVVRFHNVTPAEFLRPHDIPLIETSLRQLQNFRHADAIWADSATNVQTLREHGINRPRAEVIPLAVDAPSRCGLLGKTAPATEILFVGRFVRSKGVLDLVMALGKVQARGDLPFRLRLIGNQRYSHPDYVAEVKSAAEGLNVAVEFLGAVDDATRERLLHEAHILAIPSYHEGFCKPVIEALRASCVPVGYAAYNLPAIVNGLGRLVSAGDILALAKALGEMIEDLSAVACEAGPRRLRLDCGTISITDFERRAHDHSEKFAFAAIQQQTVNSVHRLFERRGSRLGKMGQTRSMIRVEPDDQMREAPRLSLNRLPDLSDWEAGGRLSDIMRELRQPVTVHRKSWEYALCVHGLDLLGAIRPDSVGLSVGAGSEAPLYWFANQVARIVATDLYNDDAHEGTPGMLLNPERFAPFSYRRDRLEVISMSADTLAFGDGTFDFAICLSSIEHFGTRDTQRRALDELARVLRAGGIACVITELILTNHRDSEYFCWEEIEDIFLSHPLLRLRGGDPDLSISESLVSFPIDLERSSHVNRSPHVVLKRGEMLWTSFSMFLQRR